MTDKATPAGVGSSAGLGPLPEPETGRWLNCPFEWQDLYTAEQMHAFRAQGAVARDEQWRTLLRTPHRMAGGCPDEVAGEDSRDLDCPACRLMQELGA